MQLIPCPKDLPIVDPHCHLWQLASGFYGWLNQTDSALLGNINPIRKDYLLEDYLIDCQPLNVQKVVHIEAASSAYCKQEIEWLIDQYNDHAILQGIVAGIDLLTDEADELLSFYSQQKKIKGVRQILNWHKEKPSYCMAEHNNYLSNPQWQKRFATLAKFDLSFDMQVWPQQLAEVVQLAKTYPDTLIILNHAAMPLKEELSFWQQQIKALAKHSQVAVKLSGFGMLNHHWDADSIRQQVDHLLNCFGFERCMFASNFPVDKLYSSFTRMMSCYYTLVNQHSESDKLKLFGKNAERLYRL